MCWTSFGFAVVPEVKYRSSVSEAFVAPSGSKSAEAPSASAKSSQPSGVAGPTATRV